MNITDTITGFIENIGIPVRFEPIHQTTFLPGILIRSGELVIDTQKLLYPGDILHEAGHLAVMPPRIRECMNGDLNFDPIHHGGELAAIAWSYAAAIHMGIDPLIVFHEHGYKDGGTSIVENFANGSAMGVHLLIWQNMAAPLDAEDPTIKFPHMLSWLCNIDRYAEAENV